MSFSLGLVTRIFPSTRPCLRRTYHHHLPRPLGTHSTSFSPRPPPLGHSAFSTSGAYRYAVPLGLGLSFLALQPLYPTRHAQCQSPPSSGAKIGGNPAADSAPESILSVYELSFGAICGICSGVFIKKGLKTIAFLLGGVFVLLQYMSSKSYITVDWSRLASTYDSALSSPSADGGWKAPTIGVVWTRFVDFLTANFQQRASFIAGLVLGIRLG